MRYAKFVSTGALGITYYYKNNIGLMGFIKNVTELFQQLWQLWLSVTVIKYMQAQPDGNASSSAPTSDNTVSTWFVPAWNQRGSLGWGWTSPIRVSCQRWACESASRRPASGPSTSTTACAPPSAGSWIAGILGVNSKSIHYQWEHSTAVKVPLDHCNWRLIANWQIRSL